MTLTEEIHKRDSSEEYCQDLRPTFLKGPLACFPWHCQKYIKYNMALTIWRIWHEPHSLPLLSNSKAWAPVFYSSFINHFLMYRQIFPLTTYTLSTPKIMALYDRPYFVPVSKMCCLITPPSSCSDIRLRRLVCYVSQYLFIPICIHYALWVSNSPSPLSSCVPKIPTAEVFFIFYWKLLW